MLYAADGEERGRRHVRHVWVCVLQLVWQEEVKENTPWVESNQCGGTNLKLIGLYSFLMAVIKSLNRKTNRVEDGICLWAAVIHSQTNLNTPIWNKKKYTTLLLWILFPFSAAMQSLSVRPVPSPKVSWRQLFEVSAFALANNAGSIILDGIKSSRQLHTATQWVRVFYWLTPHSVVH